jgi:hypothetical protein
MKYKLKAQYLPEGEYEIHKESYRNGRIALVIGDGDMVASVNMTDAFCPEDHTYIKDYSENEGIKQALIDAGVIGPAIKYVCSSFVTVTLHKVLI